MENKSKREIERELLSHSTTPEKHFQEKTKVVTATHTEIRFQVESGFLEKLEELRNLLAHSYPTASIKDLLGHCLNIALEKARPKAPKAKTENPSPLVEVTRFIPAEVKRKVWARDAGQCTYENNGRKCNSKHGLELIT